jgi:hypothetical protein
MATTRQPNAPTPRPSLDLDLNEEQTNAVRQHIQIEVAYGLGVVVSRIIDWTLAGNVSGSLQARIKALAWATGYGPMTGNGSMTDSAKDVGVSRAAMQQLVSRCREHLRP